MVALESKSFDETDDVRPFVGKGEGRFVTLGGSTVARASFEPGWRWSENVRPIAGTDSCESPHFGYVISGRMHVVMDDGTEGEVGPNDLVRIEPGHDAWVVGDESCEMIDFGTSPTYAKRGA